MTGFINVDKPEGISSAFVVNRIKRLTHAPCGHLGTLDPLAEGVLPVGVGNATRLFSYFLDKTKVYRARFRFGWTTPTLDRESDPKACGPVPGEADIAAALPRLTGEILQVPPAYSAVCVDGKRSYELARKGRKIELSARTVRVEAFRLTGKCAEDEFEFEVVCGAGTYIRALARDLGAALGTGAYMTYLRRTESGAFREDTAVPLEKLTAENIASYLIPTDSVLPFPRLDMEDERYYRGVRFPVKLQDGVYKIYHGGEFYGIGAVEEGVLRPEKKLC